MPTNLVLINIIGGALLLLYGMRLAGEGMQSLAGARLRYMLGSLTNQRMRAVAVGAVATALLQSSSATTVMLVGLAGAGYLGLEQTLGVILGADLGTTLTVQLIAFNILDYALALIGLGAVLILATRRRIYRFLGQAILGFGAIFLAMKIMGDAVAPARESELFLELLQSLAGSPLVMVLLSAVFTAIIQTSAGTIGMALVLANQGVLGLDLALPIVLGANIGTSATALVSSVGAPAEARRVAIAHLLFKVLGVALVYPFLSGFASLASLTSGDLARQIAWSHTLFNLGLAVVFLPFTSIFARMLRVLIPEEVKEAFGPKYLDPRALDTPALAFGQARREALRTADIAQGMVRDSLQVLKTNDEELLEDIHRRDDQIDLLTTEVKNFLTRLAEHDLTEELSRQEIGLLYVVGDLEHIGDIVDVSLMDLAKKKIERHAEFSKEGTTEIEDLHAKVSENLELVVSAFTASDRALAEKVLRHKTSINQIERELRQAHIQRLHAGLRESIETSSIHLDVINDLKRINSHATNIAYAVLGEI